MENNCTREIDAAGESRLSVMRRTMQGGGEMYDMTFHLLTFFNWITLVKLKAMSLDDHFVVKLNLIVDHRDFIFG